MRGTLLTLTGAAAFCVATSSFGAVVTQQDYESATTDDLNTNNQAFLWRAGLSGSSTGFDGASAASPITLNDSGVFGSSQSANIAIDTNDGEVPVIRFNVNSSAGVNATTNPEFTFSGATTSGYVGYYYRIAAEHAAANLKLAITLDNPTTGDTSNLIDAVADGNWHVAQWDMSDSNVWNAFFFDHPTLGDGQITAADGVSYDSLYITGAEGVDFSIDIDNISYDVDGMLAEVPAIPEPATFALLGLGGLAMLRRRK